MQSRGKTYDYSGQTTEWEDILINKGITTKSDVLLSKGLNPLDFEEKKEEIYQEESEQEILEKLTLDELNELEDEEEFSDMKILQSYKEKRLQELKQQAVRNRFGELIEIIKDDWIREVTDGSLHNAVVVFLYGSGSIECELMDETLQILAPKFKYIKFLKIKYDQAIENWPERNLPTLFIYENGVLKTQLITLKAVNGKKMSPLDLEWFFVEKGIIHDSELDGNPREDDTASKSKNTLILKSKHSIMNDDDDDIED